MTSLPHSKAVAVYCGSSIGTQKAYRDAALSLGNALAEAKRPLVYGGGSKGIMGVVSGAVLQGGGQVTGVLPVAMVAAGGEGEQVASSTTVVLNEKGRENVETIVVNSMHDRKVEMAKRVGGFFGLPGGFGTFEEILEVTTWTQLGIHRKPVVVLNVLSFFEPLRQLIKNGVREGFIRPYNEHLIVFVDGPGASASPEEHESYDWGGAGLKALDEWNRDELKPLFDWAKRKEGDVGAVSEEDGNLGAT